MYELVKLGNFAINQCAPIIELLIPIIMILIIPSIDLEHGHCQRCIQGLPGTESLYSQISDHPYELARLWRRENAKSLHITDHDAMDEHNPTSNTDTILEMVKSVDIPIQLLSSFPTIEQCEFWLEHGVYRIILNEVLLSDFESVKSLVKKYTPSRVVIGIRSNQGKALFPDIEVDITDSELAELAKSAGITRMVYSDIAWEGSLQGPDFTVLKNIGTRTNMRITVGGGVGGPKQLWDLQQLTSIGLDSVIVGRALYENRFPCQRMWRAIEAKLEPSIVENEI